MNSDTLATLEARCQEIAAGVESGALKGEALAAAIANT
jgi:hypothetical protein